MQEEGHFGKGVGKGLLSWRHKPPARQQPEAGGGHGSRGWAPNYSLPHPLWVSMVTARFSLAPVEGLKVVEIEKCKSDIKKMREELAARSNR